MADPTARTLQLLELLQSSPQRTVAQLSERLDVDERTVRRDVARLVGLGIQVESVRGRHGGYRLAPGGRILPITFSSAEVVAIFLRLAHSQASSEEPDLAVQTALSKIKRAMRPEEAKRIDAVLAAMTSSGRHRDVDPDPAVMLTLAEAAQLGRVVELRYRDRDGAWSRRAVHPYGLVAHSGRWYLVAFDPTQQDERTFRVDRIRTARSTPDTFVRPQHDDLGRRLLDLFADADYRWRVVLRIRGTEEHIRARLPPGVARLERLDSDEDRGSGDAPPWHRAEIRAEHLDWLCAVIVALDCEVVIDHPAELRDQVRAASTRMLRAVGDVP